ncbi:NUDIX hydrolase domain-like protein [Ganoderma leucocontextum]|nr:NUDIX hydrolase domain-like protein [Ganoderma leucocontextum]
MAPEPYAHYFSGNPLNRLAWLRTSQPFLNAIIHAPATRWVVFREGQPLLQFNTSTAADARSGTFKQSLARLTTLDVKPLLGPEPYFSQGQHDGELAPPDLKALEGARLRGNPIAFLGLHETQTTFAAALPSSDFSAKADPQTVIANIKGTPYFSLDVSDADQAEVDRVLRENASVREAQGKLNFTEPRAAMGALDVFESAIFAEARTIVDWNARNKFCASCGGSVHSSWAGWKLTCSTLLPWAENTGKKPCATATGLHNFSHPRTDPVVITAVVDETGDNILLGRNTKWPKNFWSCMSGFNEPGESFEDAVKRELWEEAGVKVWNVRYHSSQPWPFPANLMCGFYATANSSEPLRTDLDNELEEARWFTREELLAVLSHTDGTRITQQEHREIAATAENSNPNANPDAKGLKGASAPAPSDRAPPFKIPPLTAIGGVILSEWAYGRAGPQPVKPKLGNL